MTTETERVTVRVPSEKLEKMDELVKSGKFTNMSDVIRAAIEKFLADENIPSNISKMNVELPKGNVIQLGQLVDSGDSVSVDDAIRNAIREYIRTHLSKALEDSKA